jgi:23S rRNA pseudouridine2457 synthase
VLALYKPYGHVSRFADEAGHPGLASLVRVPDVYAAGRLDHDSEGLLLLTDDGELAHALTDPRRGHPRTYWVQVERIPDATALAALARGIVVQGRRTRPAQVRLLREPPPLPPRSVPIRFRKSVPTAWLELSLREGRNRQVRRMAEAVGNDVVELRRVRFGPVELGALPMGEARRLSEAEVASLWEDAEL